MPIYKYKSFEEAEKALWNIKPDANYFERVSELWEFADKLNPIKYPQGIFKFKTIEQANQHRDAIEIAHARKLQMKRIK